MAIRWAGVGASVGSVLCARHCIRLMHIGTRI
jgi:hypothetical protein